MRRLVAVVAMLVLVGSATHADALTCAAYRKRLVATLQHAPHGMTLVVAEGRRSQTIPHTTFPLSAGTGLTGNLECFDADRLQEVDFSADLKGLSAHDATTRTAALQSLAVAATCAIPGASGGRCASVAKALFARVRHQLAVVTARGDPLPAADETSELSGAASLDLSAEPGTTQYAIFLREPVARP